nr:ComEC/Rec2 family competence protein [uncultured Cohaesibacter sp.]
MGAGKAEKGENAPLTSSDKAIGVLTLASPKEKLPISVGKVRVTSFQPSVGFWTRLYLRLEAVGLLLAANWREDCERRNARFLWCALAMAFGAASYYSLPDEPSLMILLGFVAVSVSWVWRRARKGAMDLLLLLVVSAGIGLSVATYQGQFSSTPVLTRAFSSSVTGVVDHIDFRQKNGRKDERWTLRVEAIDRIGSDPQPERLLLVRKALGTRFNAGDRVKLWARLQPLQRPAFPGAFDYARYLWARSIGGQGYMGRDIERLPKVDVSGLSGLWAEARHRIETLRNAIAEQIAARMKGEAGGLAIALAVGKRDYLSNEVKDALRQSGLAHILAISGLHMALVAMSIFWGARALFALVPSLALSYPIKQWSAGIALLCAFGYLVLSGNSVATIRAFLMTAIILLAILLGRPALTLHNLALALIVVIVVQPYSLVEAGMQMSFGATAALIASYDRLRAIRIHLGVKQEASDMHHHPKAAGRMMAFARTALRWVGGIGATSLIAGIAVLPFSIAHFQQMAPLGLLANLMVMPIVTLVVMPLGLVSILLVPIGLQSLTLPLVAWGLEQVIATARWIVAQSDDRLLVVSGQGMVLSLIVLALAAYAIHRRGLALLAFVPVVAALVV